MLIGLMHTKVRVALILNLHYYGFIIICKMLNSVDFLLFCMTAPINMTFYNRLVLNLMLYKQFTLFMELLGLKKSSNLTSINKNSK